jgi:hypothetical protein
VPAIARGSRLSLRCAPNPARSRAALSFTLPSPGRVALAVFDPAGRRVATLVDDEWMTAGPHLVTLRTGAIQAGLYFARLEFGFERSIQRLVVVR